MEQKTAIGIVAIAIIIVGIILLNPQLLGKASGTTGNTPETNPAKSYACIPTCVSSGCEIVYANTCLPVNRNNGDWTCEGGCQCIRGGPGGCPSYNCVCRLEEMTPTPKKEDEPN